MLVGGTALGQAILLAASPMLTRLYTPEDFGTAAVFTSIVGVIAVVASLRYQLAVPVPEDDSEALHVLVLAGLLALLSAAVLGLALLTFSDRIATAVPSIGPFLWLMPASVLAIGLYQALSYWAIRKQAFGLMARTRLTQSGLAVATQLAVGVLGAGPLGLILGQVIGRSAGTVRLLQHTWVSAKTSRAALSVRRLRWVAVRYSRFPLYSTWTGLTNSLGREAPALVLAALFGATTTGHFALGARVLQAPMTLVGEAIGQVFFARAADASRSGELRELVLTVLEQLLRIGMPAITVIALAAPELFSLVFGPLWRTAGVYAQWFAPWLILVFVTSPMSTLPSVLERQRPELAFQVALLASRIGALAIGGVRGDAMLAIALFSIVSAANWFTFLLWTVRIAGAPVKAALAALGRSMAFSAALAVPTVVGKVVGVTAASDFPVLVGASVSLVLTAGALFRSVRTVGNA